jgi:hypothetical protein
MHNRRRIDRQPASWVGSCRFEGESDTSWRECRVVDISTLGLAVTFDYPTSSELQGRFILVNFSGDAGAVNVRLEGEIKSAVPAINKEVRIGIEFIRVSETEQAIACVLAAMSKALVA